MDENFSHEFHEFNEFFLCVRAAKRRQRLRVRLFLKPCPFGRLRASSELVEWAGCQPALQVIFEGGCNELVKEAV